MTTVVEWSWLGVPVGFLLGVKVMAFELLDRRTVSVMTCVERGLPDGVAPPAAAPVPRLAFQKAGSLTTGLMVFLR